MGNELKYTPEYAVPPGWVLEDFLEAQNMSQAELARRCDRSAKLVSEIISGSGVIEPRTAIEFERVLGMDASIWLSLQAKYDLFRIKESEHSEWSDWVDWYRSFPIQELVKRRVFDQPRDDRNGLDQLLKFFGVAHPSAWHTKYGEQSVAYRKSFSFSTDEGALAAWLRMGELDAMEQECGDFDSNSFKEALALIRQLTTLKPDTVAPSIVKHCNKAGVAFSLRKGFKGAPVSGASRWLTPKLALIQQSARHLSDDHFWITFFHEAAHILLHNKKGIFVDAELSEQLLEIELEANEWSLNYLIPKPKWDEFACLKRFPSLVVQSFANEVGVSPGIVVGRLQREKKLSWKSPLNKLKKFYSSDS